mmetsp:Transcript_29145/g.65244  ORF Transcript_29145/g.65244 Transcript_29145/m.65244 type:complete len:302 (-) Transcript_29145:544-1449(-)
MMSNGLKAGQLDSSAPSLGTSLDSAATTIEPTKDESNQMFTRTPVEAPVDMPIGDRFRRGTFVNERGLRLATFCFDRPSVKPRGLVFLAHGYSVHTLYEWLMPEAPGAPHNRYVGSVASGLVEAGFDVVALDHTGHGHSMGQPRCYFRRFSDLADEASAFLQREIGARPGLPVFLFGQSMGGATCVAMALRSEAKYGKQIFDGLVLYAPMLSLARVREATVFTPPCAKLAPDTDDQAPEPLEIGDRGATASDGSCCAKCCSECCDFWCSSCRRPIRNKDLEPVAACLSACCPYLPVAKVNE